MTSLLLFHSFEKVWSRSLVPAVFVSFGFEMTKTAFEITCEESLELEEHAE